MKVRVTSINDTRAIDYDGGTGTKYSLEITSDNPEVARKIEGKEWDIVDWENYYEEIEPGDEIDVYGAEKHNKYGWQANLSTPDEVTPNEHSDMERLMYIMDNRVLPMLEKISKAVVDKEDGDYPEPTEEQMQHAEEDSFAKINADDTDIDEIDF